MLPSVVTSELKKHQDDQYWIENQNKLFLNMNQQLHALCSSQL